ncbi:MAG: alpha/beta fold hydrolase [Bacteroidetes bacterium]|nr:alpha/beta fold hydrolase [Bacteroidota bacterium]
MQLNFKKIGEGFPVVILHGLMGSLDNWQTIAKKMAVLSESVFHNPLCIYTIDQRNHGRSPHSSLFDYACMTTDLYDFFKQQNIEKAHLIGHSMGGKVAMNFAFQFPELTEKLVVVDIAPESYSDKHSDVFDALFATHASTAESRDAVQAILRSKLQDETTVQFLLKSLTRSEMPGVNFEWRFNLEALHKNYAAISGDIPSANPFHGPSLFVKGSNSNYITSSNYGRIAALFPHHTIEEIKQAGHWVHAEKPDEFTDIVLRFITVQIGL